MMSNRYLCFKVSKTSPNDVDNLLASAFKKAGYTLDFETPRMDQDCTFHVINEHESLAVVLVWDWDIGGLCDLSLEDLNYQTLTDHPMHPMIEDVIRAIPDATRIKWCSEWEEKNSLST